MKNYLEFERDIKELEEELEKLKDPFKKEGLSEVETEKIASIQSQIDEKLKVSSANLYEWQITMESDGKFVIIKNMNKTTQ